MRSHLDSGPATWTDELAPGGSTPAPGARSKSLPQSQAAAAARTSQDHDTLASLLRDSGGGGLRAKFKRAKGQFGYGPMKDEPWSLRLQLPPCQ